MIRRFNRYELKYVLPWARCEALIADLKHHVPVDQNGGHVGYQVVSLYYDSPEHDFFWAKVEGIRYRRKIRLRAYVERNIEDISECTVEIKQRINRTVQKRRLLLPLAQAERLCTGAGVPPELDSLDQRVAEEVTYMVRAKQLVPTTITAYHRRAFEGMHTNAGLRVTFDTDVRARVHALKLDESAQNRHIVPPGWAIMEVKANEAVPSWMLSLLGRHDCLLRRVSKYCLGLATLKPISEHASLVAAGVFPTFGESIRG